MTTQEIRITAQITLEVPIELSKEGLLHLFEGARVEINPLNSIYGNFHSHLDVIEIEEEAQIYGTSEDFDETKSK